MIRIYDNLEKAREILQRRTMTTLDEVPAAVLSSIERVFGEPLTPEAAVARLLGEVGKNGDTALRTWTQRIDGLSMDQFEVPKSLWEKAYHALDANLREALEKAVGAYSRFSHAATHPNWTTESYGRRVGTADGAYAAGGDLCACGISTFALIFVDGGDSCAGRRCQAGLCLHTCRPHNRSGLRYYACRSLCR